jgi:hypothetical protein
MKSVIAALALLALAACTAPGGNDASDERVMHAAGSGVTVSAEEALAAAKRANEAKASQATATPAAAIVEVE